MQGHMQIFRRSQHFAIKGNELNAVKVSGELIKNKQMSGIGSTQTDPSIKRPQSAALL